MTKTLPHHIDAEASILGGILLRNEVLGHLDGLEVEDLYDNRHKVVFQAIRNLQTAGSPIDVVTLENEIAKAGKLEAIGGVAFLGYLAERVPTPDNVIAYSQIVRGHHAVRRAMIAGSDLTTRGYTADDPAEYLSEAIGELQRIEQDFKRPSTVMPRGFSTMPRRVSGEREDRIESAKRGISYLTSFLDDRLRLMLPHELVVITARSGVGKTQMALDIATRNALVGLRVGYFALEAEPRELERRSKYRWLARTAYDRRMPGHDKLNYKDWMLGRCEDIVGAIEPDADLWFATKLSTLWTYYKGVEKFDADTMSREMVDIAKQVELMVLDHLHYVDAKDGDDDNRSVTRITTTLRTIALALGKPVIAVAHLRKRVGPERTLLPDKDDLMGSSNLPKIATTIIALAPAPFVTPPKWWLAPTLIGVIKDRHDGEDGLAALTYFDKRYRMYSQHYTLGRLLKGGTEWEAIKAGDVPAWARGHKQLEMELAT